MKSNHLNVIFSITLFALISSSSIAQVAENNNQEQTVQVQLNENQQKLVDSLIEYGESDLLKIKERYTHKLRTNPEPGDDLVLDRINQQIKIVRGAKQDQ